MKAGREAKNISGSGTEPAISSVVRRLVSKIGIRMIMAGKVSMGNPILYMVNAFRYGILGTSDIDIVWAYLITAVFVVGLFGLNLFLLNRGVGIRE